MPIQENTVQRKANNTAGIARLTLSLADRSIKAELKNIFEN